MPYEDEQVQTLVILNVVASTFSFLGATFIIANFVAFKEFHDNIAFRLVLFVAIGDVINSVGNFLGSPDPDSFVCYLQAFLTQFGDFVSFAWVTAVAFVIHRVFKSEQTPTKQDVMRWYKNIHLVIWPITIIISVLPFFTSSYGYDNGLCWIVLDDDNDWGEVWRYICFYIPLWGCFLYIGFCYCRVWRELNAAASAQNDSAKDVHRVDTHTGRTNAKELTSPDADVGGKPSSSDVLADAGHQQQNSDIVDGVGAYQVSTTDVRADGTTKEKSTEDNNPPKSGGGTLQRIKYYPFALFFCYLFATIRRIAESASPDEFAPFWIAALQVFTSALLGTCNAVLYGFTPVVRNKDSEWIRAHCCGEKGDDEDRDEQLR
eukprot:CAMPEP_0202688104 /NCGR_PEP_ID=MMETSP1385-20130828/3638_1 /ASSEMBLY_ACC=CAM_ASM_000861 /TAXON_ID=933848 /ORGANISM="Elphidium margaritaceum" /LENGTH=374 /DNA_ID=CAMNT_0049342991 /DNA_START=93 /DNA_END=1217 /DNA_ORIENTATION=+